MSEAIKAAVIGHPVAHSKSPLIHHYWIKCYGQNGSYEAIDLSPDNLADGIARLVAGGYKGFNVTVPHKQAVLGLCDELDMGAQSIGAVNTVVIEGAKMRGMNTDAYGFLTNITHATGGFSFERKCAVVLGAGGAARAIVSGLIGQKIGRIVMANRSMERACALAEDMNMGTGIIEVAEWEHRSAVLQQADLLVNTTMLGMKGQPPLEIDLRNLPQHALVNDIVYAPLMTDLLRDAQSRGNRIVTGIGMLLHQAQPAFKAWFGVLPEVTPALEEMVLA